MKRNAKAVVGLMVSVSLGLTASLTFLTGRTEAG